MTGCKEHQRWDTTIFWVDTLSVTVQYNNRENNFCVMFIYLLRGGSVHASFVFNDKRDNHRDDTLGCHKSQFMNTIKPLLVYPVVHSKLSRNDKLSTNINAIPVAKGSCISCNQKRTSSLVIAYWGLQTATYKITAYFLKITYWWGSD
jgi:hypothetical protein